VACALGVLALPGCAPRDERPDVILITIDTLRADRLGAYGDDQVSTPTLDALAREGARFTRASAVTPVTLPSHASILTGRYPSSHGVRNNGTFRLPADVATLAEALGASGWHAEAAVGAVVLAARYGLARGFDHYDDAFEQDGRTERRAAEVTDAVLARLPAIDDDAPLFLWAHYFDPHASYEPPPPFDAAVDRYRGEIAYTDREIGRLLDGLGRAGRLDNAVVVVVADHGEAFGEHGETHHGLFVYEPTVHVPMIATWKGRIAPGTVVDAVVSQVDLAPTLLGLLGLPAMPDVDGVDLSPTLRAAGEPAARRGVRIENLLPRLEFGWSPLHAFREDDWKYIAAPRPELYDLAADPGETEDLVARESRRAEVAARILDEALADAATRADEAATPIDPATIAQLRSLGYVGTSAPEGALDAPEGSALPDPKDRLDEYRSAKKISAHLAREEFDEAIAEARRSLAGDPGNVRILHSLGEALVRSGRAAEGERVYLDLLAAHPGDCTAMWRLGEIAEVARGDVGDADARYRASLDCDPAQPDLWWRRARLARADGRAGEVAPFLDRAIEYDPLRVDYRDERARAAFEAGDVDLAARHWGEAWDVRPDFAPAAVGLGRVAASRGNAREAERRFRAAIAADPLSADARANLGALLLRERDYDAGIEETRRAIELDPTLAQARFNLAVALVREGRLDEARDQFDRYALDVPGDARGWAVLARALESAGRRDDARQAWERALRADPTDGDARRALGR